MDQAAKKNKVTFTVSTRRAYYNGKYLSQWKVFRVEELGGGLVAKKCIADVYGPRKLALAMAGGLK